ncbi:MAG: hypothetical protein KDA42_06105 [Planctomycetales bacterium]|nr:hypothetical protein [Planctomycetales bacterium]
MQDFIKAVQQYFQAGLLARCANEELREARFDANRERYIAAAKDTIARGRAVVKQGTAIAETLDGDCKSLRAFLNVIAAEKGPLAAEERWPDALADLQAATPKKPTPPKPDVPAEYRYGGKPDGEILRTAKVEEILGIHGSTIGRRLSARTEIDGSRGYAYAWKSVFDYAKQNNIELT